MALRPYHCASNCFRPVAEVSGSANMASSVHKESLRFEGKPAKRSNTEQVRSDCVGESGVGEGGMGEWILYVAKEGEVLAGAEAEVAMVERSWNWDREGVLLLNGRRRESCLRTGRGNVSKMVGGMGLLGWRRIDCHDPVLGDMMGQFTSNTGGL